MNIKDVLTWAYNWNNGKHQPMPNDALALFKELDELVADLRSDELPFMHQLYDWLHVAIYTTPAPAPQNDSPSITVPVEDVTGKVRWRKHIQTGTDGDWLFDVASTSSGMHITLNNLTTKERKQFIIPYQGIVEGLIALESEKSE